MEVKLESKSFPSYSGQTMKVKKRINHTKKMKRFFKLFTRLTMGASLHHYERVLVTRPNRIKTLQFEILFKKIFALQPFHFVTKQRSLTYPMRRRNNTRTRRGSYARCTRNTWEGNARNAIIVMTRRSYLASYGRGKSSTRQHVCMQMEISQLVRIDVERFDYLVCYGDDWVRSKVRLSKRAVT